MANIASPRDVIPLEIGRYLQDTADLNGAESGAYLHLIMHCWLHGSLPSEDEKLATIAKFRADAWSIARASVMHYFVRSKDGRYRNPGVDKRRDAWVDKRLKAREKATKAARARWDRSKEERAKKRAKKADAPSIALASPSIEHVPPEVPSLSSPHTPYLSQPPNPLPGGVPPLPDPPCGERARTQRGSGGSREAGQGQDGKGKAKTTKTALGGFLGPGGTNGLSEVSQVAGKIVVRGATGILGKVGDVETSISAEGRFGMFQDEVFRFWSAQNPDRPSCPWTRLDSKALLEYLRGSPDSTLEHFQMLLRNRAASGINPAALPRNWLRNLEEYSDGPLDRFQKPVRQARTL